MSWVSEDGNGDAGVQGHHWLDPEVLILPSPSPGSPFASRAASPSSTFWAALLDGAVALVSERSLRSWSSADGPRRRINAYSINVHCISRSLWKICCALETAESCSEHVCCQTALLTSQNPAPRWAKSPPGSAAGLGSFTDVSVRSRVVRTTRAAVQAASLISWY